MKTEGTADCCKCSHSYGQDALRFVKEKGRRGNPADFFDIYVIFQLK